MSDPNNKVYPDYSENNRLEYDKLSFNSISSLSLVILVGVVWSTFVLFCQSKGIEVSGMKSSKRHILSNSGYLLNQILNFVYRARTDIATVKNKQKLFIKVLN